MKKRYEIKMMLTSICSVICIITVLSGCCGTDDFLKNKNTKGEVSYLSNNDFDMEGTSELGADDSSLKGNLPSANVSLYDSEQNNQTKDERAEQHHYKRLCPYELYDNILALFQELVDNDFFPEKSLDEFAEWGFASGVRLNIFFQRDINLHGNDLSSQFYGINYAFFDVDGNGVQELIIGIGGGYNAIRHIFTWQEGQVYNLFNVDYFGERVNVNLRDNGVFSIFGDDGWEIYGYNFYCISPEGNAVILFESVERQRHKFYRGSWNAREEISEYEFLEIVRKYTGYESASRSKGIALEWRPLRRGLL